MAQLMEADVCVRSLTAEIRALKDRICNFVAEGIVTRSALQNAASIAGLLLTTEALVTEIPEKEKTPPMPPGGMGGMDY